MMDSISSFMQPLRANRDYSGDQLRRSEKPPIEDYDEHDESKSHKCGCDTKNKPCCGGLGDNCNCVG